MKHRRMTVHNCNDWDTHTPGPWLARNGKVWGVEDGTIGGLLVATLDPAVLEEEVAMKEADARLIAAAPELLLALSDMLDQFEDNEQYDVGDAKIIARARAAYFSATDGIARARAAYFSATGGDA